MSRGFVNDLDIETIGGQRPTVGTFDQLVVAYGVRDIAVKWEYGLYDDNFDMMPVISTGDGEQTFDNGSLVASSAVTGTVKLSSKKVTRYRSGNGGFAWFTALLNSGAGICEAGLISDNNDKIIVRQNNGVVSFGYAYLGADLNFITSDSFNGDADVSLIDWTVLNIFKIEYGYLGSAVPSLFIKQGGKTVLLHSFLKDTTVANTYVRFPQFRIMIYAENGAEIKSSSWSAGTYSNILESRGEDPSARPFYNGGERTGIEGSVEAPIVAFRSKTTYNGFNHSVQAKLLQSTFSTNSEGMYAYNFYFNPTTVTGGTYVDINTLSSVIEVNEGATAWTGGQKQFRLIVSVSSQGTGVATENIDFEKLGVFLNAGDEVVITKEELVAGGSGSPADLNVYDFNWQELF